MRDLQIPHRQYIYVYVTIDSVAGYSRAMFSCKSFSLLLLSVTPIGITIAKSSTLILSMLIHAQVCVCVCVVRYIATGFSFNCTLVWFIYLDNLPVFLCVAFSEKKRLKL